MPRANHKPPPSAYERTLAPMLANPSMARTRAWVREHGGDAVHALMETAAHERWKQEEIDAGCDAVLVAQIEATMGGPESPRPFEDLGYNGQIGRHLEVDAGILRATANRHGEPFDEDEFVSWAKRDLYFYWHLLRFVRAGQHAYEVSPGLAAKLAETELRGLTADDLHLPFPSISIHVPPEARLTAGPNEAGVAPPVTELYLSEDAIEGVRNWRVLALAGSPGPSYIFGILLPAAQSLEECIRATSDLLRAQGAPDETEWLTIFRWAMNVVIYATNGGIRVELWRNTEAAELLDRIESMPPESKTRRRLQDRLDAMDKRRRVVLGPGIEVDRAEAPGSGQRLTIRVRVQGHWRRQAHGQGFKERKLIWIEPFWRGPEDGATPPGPAHRLI